MRRHHAIDQVGCNIVLLREMQVVVTTITRDTNGLAGFVHIDAIREQVVHLRMFFQRGSYRLERTGSQCVVAVQEGHVLPACYVDRSVLDRADPSIRSFYPSRQA
ncbi:hypothetical protein D3C84_805830 [compost metagenome]